MNTSQRSAFLNLILVAAGAAATVAQPVDPIVDRQAIVQLVAGADIAAYNLRTGTSTLKSIAEHDMYLLELPAGDEYWYLHLVLEPDPETVWAELNYVGDAPEGSGRSFYFAIGNDPFPYFNQPTWGQLGLDEAQQTSLGAGVVIAVIDSGVDLTHPALVDHFPVGRVAGWNFIDDSPDVSDVGNGVDDDGDGDTDEMTGHGTHVAGILAHVAPEAVLLPVKVLDSEGNTDCFTLAQGLFYALDQGASVINVSIGSTYDARMVEIAVERARERGAVLVAAAGNTDSMQPEYPALHAGVLGVASVDTADVKSEFSNYNAQIALSAVGSEVFSTIPGGLYAAWNGTSMATPMVAGAAALLLAAHPEWPANAFRPDQVRAFLAQSAADLDALNPEYAGLLGAGRLDAAAMFQAALVFNPPVAYFMGAPPAGVTTAELDGDGRPDVVVASPTGGLLTVLLNTAGGLVYGPTLAIGGAPRAIAAADFNGDGFVDLAAADSAAAGVIVVWNQGGGALGPTEHFAAGNGPRDVAAADLDQDGDVDLVTADENSASLSVLHNDFGAFVTVATLPAPSRAQAVAAGDLDGDGRIDLAVVGRDAAQLVLYQGTPGGFVAWPAVPVGVEPRDVAAADLDQDGDLDLVTANHDSLDVTIAWNLGGGTFTTSSLELNQQPDAICARDLNCDGRPDLSVVASAAGSGSVLSLLSAGGGVFGPPLPVGVGAEPTELATADLDGDGDADLAVPDELGGALAVLMNYTCATRVTGDLNCDGALTFGDINPFVMALAGHAPYAAAHPDCNWLNADANEDGAVTFADINAFITLLTAQP